MATVPAEPMPLILTNASLKLGPAPGDTLTELACIASHIELSPDVAVTTVDTFCGSRDYPGQVKWSLIASLFQSFDPGATEEVLSEILASGENAFFEVVGYRDQPVSVTNPAWTGEAIPKPYAPINGDAGDTSAIDLEWSIVGEPLKSTAPAAPLATSTSSSSSSSG